MIQSWAYLHRSALFCSLQTVARAGTVEVIQGLTGHLSSPCVCSAGVSLGFHTRWQPRTSQMAAQGSQSKYPKKTRSCITFYDLVLRSQGCCTVKSVTKAWPSSRGEGTDFIKSSGRACGTGNIPAIVSGIWILSCVFFLSLPPALILCVWPWAQ